MGSSVIANDVSLSSSPNATFFGRQSVTLPIQDAIFQFKITGLFQDLDSTKQIIVLRLFALNLMGLARRAGHARGLRTETDQGRRGCTKKCPEPGTARA